MTSLERVLTTLAYNEPDRVPFFLLLTMHGATLLNLSIPDYFSKAEYVVEGQLKLRERYNDDCVVGFLYAAIETEAFGGEVIFREDGPPNAGAPIIRTEKDLQKFEVSDILSHPSLLKTTAIIKKLKHYVGDEVPIIGVVMSPLSLPVMQMGFEAYLDIMFHHPRFFDRLMVLNSEFCVAWAQTQLEAGATAICYFDPVSSSSIISRETYLTKSYPITKTVLSQINGPIAIHFASGRCLPILDYLADSGAAVVGTSSLEDLGIIKSRAQQRLSIIGNLNGVAMRTWSTVQAEEEIKQAITKAGTGGGFILSDNHGEIPFQVSDEILLSISEAVHKWGRYPLSLHE